MRSLSCFRCDFFFPPPPSLDLLSVQFQTFFFFLFLQASLFVSVTLVSVVLDMLLLLFSLLWKGFFFGGVLLFRGFVPCAPVFLLLNNQERIHSLM